MTKLSALPLPLRARPAVSGGSEVISKLRLRVYSLTGFAMIDQTSAPCSRAAHAQDALVAFFLAGARRFAGTSSSAAAVLLLLAVFVFSGALAEPPRLPRLRLSNSVRSKTSA